MVKQKPKKMNRNRIKENKKTEWYTPFVERKY